MAHRSFDATPKLRRRIEASACYRSLEWLTEASTAHRSFGTAPKLKWRTGRRPRMGALLEADVVAVEPRVRYAAMLDGVELIAAHVWKRVTRIRRCGPVSAQGRDHAQQ